MYPNRTTRTTRSSQQTNSSSRCTHSTHDHTLCGHEHDHTFFQELICHIPLTVISLAMGFVLVALVKAIIGVHGDDIVYNDLFHTCHYAHLLFAAAGAAATFFRFAQSISFFGILMSMAVPFIFCTLSDIVFPSLGAQLIGIPIKMHLCILHGSENFTVFMFLICGALAGACLANGSKQTMRQYAGYMHFFHIFVSALAALFYMMMHGIDDLVGLGGILLLILIISVVIPCTFSDCLVPLSLGRWYASRNLSCTKECDTAK